LIIKQFVAFKIVLMYKAYKFFNHTKLEKAEIVIIIKYIDKKSLINKNDFVDF